MATISPPHSTLELAKHDKTTTAPERDHAGAAPENNRDLDALQTAPDAGVELVYDDAVPERVSSHEETRSVKASSWATSVFSASTPIKIVMVAAIVAIMVGAAVGAGVGIGVRKNSTSSSSSAMAASTVTRTALPSSTALNIPLLTDKRILNDTSVASLALSNGDRRLFFQEASGLIRQAFYSASTGGWRADTSYIVASDAKNHTPLAAINAPGYIPGKDSGLANFDAPVIQGGPAVFYISQNNSLACAQFYRGEWSPTTQSNQSSYFANISRYTATPDSRHLSVKVLLKGRLLGALVVYEGSHGEPSLLNGTLTLPPIPPIKNNMEMISNSTNGTISPAAVSSHNPFWVWKDSSSKLAPTNFTSNLGYGAPFDVFGGEQARFELLFAAKYSNNSYSDSAISGSLLSLENEDDFYAKDIPAHFDSRSIDKSDLIVIALNDSVAATRYHFGQYYGFWVNGAALTALVTPYFQSLPSMPNSSFPFTRLTGFSPANASNFFMYHQLNAWSFAEDEWDDSVGGWISNSFQVATA